jgi:TetR/AcrR family transcriptional repressor of nem operon
VVRPRTFDEELVLEGAVQAFREHGYEGISVPELIERLGICRQSLYTAFGDKRGLYLRALERWGRREVDAKVDLLTSQGSPLENVRTVVRSLADLALRCPGEGCLTSRGIVETHGDPEALAVLEAQVERLENAMVDALTRAAKCGELTPEARPERLARALVTVFHGIGVLARLPSSGPRIGDSVAVMLGLLEDAAA